MGISISSETSERCRGQTIGSHVQAGRGVPQQAGQAGCARMPEVASVPRGEIARVAAGKPQGRGLAM